MIILPDLSFHDGLPEGEEEANLKKIMIEIIKDLQKFFWIIHSLTTHGLNHVHFATARVLITRPLFLSFVQVLFSWLLHIMLNIMQCDCYWMAIQMSSRHLDQLIWWQSCQWSHLWGGKWFCSLRSWHHHHIVMIIDDDRIKKECTHVCMKLPLWQMVPSIHRSRRSIFHWVHMICRIRKSYQLRCLYIPPPPFRVFITFGAIIIQSSLSYGVMTWDKEETRKRSRRVKVMARIYGTRYGLLLVIGLISKGRRITSSTEKWWRARHAMLTINSRWMNACSTWNKPLFHYHHDFV